MRIMTFFGAAAFAAVASAQAADTVMDRALKKKGELTEEESAVLSFAVANGDKAVTAGKSAAGKTAGRLATRRDAAFRAAARARTAALYAEGTAAGWIVPRGRALRGMMLFADRKHSGYPAIHSGAAHVFGTNDQYGVFLHVSMGLSPASKYIPLIRNCEPGGTWDAYFNSANKSNDHYSFNIIDFAGMDYALDHDQWCRYLEATIRRFAGLGKGVMICYSAEAPLMADYAAGKVPWQVEEGERLAAHYGVPSVNFAQFVRDRRAAGKKFDAKAQSALLEAALADFACDVDAAKELPAVRPLPDPVHGRLPQRPNRIAYEELPMSGLWKVGQEPDQPYRQSYVLHQLVSEAAGNTLTLRFKGSEVGICEFAAPGSEAYEVSVDGGAFAAVPAPAAPALAKRGLPVVCGLDPSREHEVVLRTTGRGRAAITAVYADGRALNADRYPGMKGEARQRAMEREIGPFDFPLDPHRFDNIPKTMAKLRGEGGADGKPPEVKILFWGNSIMANTSSSQFWKKVQKMYPKCKIVPVNSWRSSTFCTWFAQDNRVNDYVVKYHPDLVLMDGGLGDSKIEEAKAKHDCIRQIRKADPNIEILLIGPYFSAFGRYTPDAKGMKEAMEIVRKAAEEEHIAYFETFTPWWKKVTQEGKCIGWYKGDGNHANPRGCRLIGMMFERWFDPSL